MKKLVTVKTFFNKQAVLFTAMLLSTFVSYCQPSPPTGGSGNGGGNPDNTPLGGVPFDNRMTLVLLLVAVVFAVIIKLKIQRNSLVRKSVN